ncbi:MAG: c-type cytochrome [Deltaproteobacteria bacterium]
MVQIYRYVYVLVLLAALSAGAYAQDASVEGPAVFVEGRCYTCHTVKAQSAEIEAAKEAFAKSKGVELKEDEDEKEESKGGDLSDIGNMRDQKWIATFLKDPRDYFKDDKKCKKEAKKKYRKRFKGPDAQFEVLVTYLTTLKYGDMQEEGFESCIIEE